MKRQYKRYLMAVLATLLILSLVACSSSPTSNPTVGATASSGSPTDIATASPPSPTADGPLTPYPQAITISWGVPVEPGQVFFNGDTYENNIWSRLIKEKLNIDVKVAFSADYTTTAYEDKMKTMLVSGDLPDIVYSFNRVFFTQAQQAGYLADIGPLLDKYSTAPVKAFQTQYPACFTGGQINGVQYGYPAICDNFYSPNYLWIRDDWLKNTNSQPPKTVDDFIKLVKTFTESNPNGDGTKTYGFTMTSTPADNMIALMEAYGVPCNVGGIYYRGSDGKITYSYIQPQVKTVLGILHDMYKAGQIDPEFTTKNMGILEADVTNNVVGMFDYQNWGDWYPFNLSFQSEKVITRAYAIPTVPGVDYKVGLNNVSVAPSYYFLNSKCANPSAIVKILNLFSATTLESSDPENFKNYYTNNQKSLSPIRIILPNELFTPQILDALAAGNSDSLSPINKPFYDYCVNFANGTDTSFPAYGTWGQESQDGSIAVSLNTYKKDNAWVENLMGAQTPQAYLDNNEILTTLMNTDFTAIITGSASLDSFDDFVKNWLANGGQQILDQMEQLYPAK
jgi:putative aldouronate transport system substrate-binding protein